jgi:Flp pilus assembly pilin Flp
MSRSQFRGACDDRGASAVEYSLIVVAIAAVIVAVVFGLGTLTKGNVTTACTNWNTAAGTTTAC